MTTGTLVDLALCGALIYTTAIAALARMEAARLREQMRIQARWNECVGEYVERLSTINGVLCRSIERLGDRVEELEGKRWLDPDGSVRSVGE